MKIIKIKSFGIIEALIASAILVVVLSAAVALSSSALRSSQLDRAYFEAEHIANDLMERVASDISENRTTFFGPGDSNRFPIDCYDTDNIGLAICRADGEYRGNLPYNPEKSVNENVYLTFRNPNDAGYGRNVVNGFVLVPRARTSISWCRTNIGRVDSEYCTKIYTEAKPTPSAEQQAGPLSPFSDGYFRFKINVLEPGRVAGGDNLAMNALGFGSTCRGAAGQNIPAEKCRLVQIDINWTETSGNKAYYLTQYFTDWEN